MRIHSRPINFRQSGLNTGEKKNAIVPSRSSRIVTSGVITQHLRGTSRDRSIGRWYRALSLRFWFMNHSRRVTTWNAPATNLPRDEATSSPDPRRLGTEVIEYREEPSRVVSARSASARSSSGTLAPYVPFISRSGPRVSAILISPARYLARVSLRKFPHSFLPSPSVSRRTLWFTGAANESP